MRSVIDAISCMPCKELVAGSKVNGLQKSGVKRRLFRTEYKYAAVIWPSFFLEMDGDDVIVER